MSLARSMTASLPVEARVAAAPPVPTVDPRRPLTVAIYMHDLAGGGVERQTLSLAEQLGELGVSVTLVLHQVRGQLLPQLPPGLKVFDLRSRRTLQDIPRLSAYLYRTRPDILLANLDHNNIAALVANGLAGGRTKTVICQHNPISSDFTEFERWTYRFVPLAYRLLAPFMSQAVAVSDGVADELRTLARLPRRKVRTINNPVVGRNFAERAAAPVDHPWFDTPGQPVFVTAGRLVVQKDHATLLRALAIHRQHTPGRLLLLGSGPLSESLQGLARELGIAEAVDFLGFRDNPLPYFRRADAFVLSSRSEGFGNVLVEAMACGTPVISTDCCHGPHEILDNGLYGALVPIQDPAALAEAMNDLPALQARCPVARLQTRAEAFTHAVCSMRYLNLFRALAPGQTAAA
jgi:glycosyltransferase involved in cell wall biosynthesis